MGQLGRVALPVAGTMAKIWQKAAPSVAHFKTRAGIGEKNQPTANLNEVLSEIARREIVPHLPDLQGLIAIHLGGQLSGPLPVKPGVEARALLEILPTLKARSDTNPLQKNCYSIVASTIGLPLKNGSIDFLLDSYDPDDRHLAANRWSDPIASLKPGAKGILVAPHPFGALAHAPKENERPGFESLFRLFRKAGVELSHVREVFVDTSLRRFFVGAEGPALFNRLNGSPLLIIFFVTKIK